MRTDKELKELAVDIYEGRVFTSQHCATSKEVGHVFMPLLLGALSGWSEEKISEDAAMVYERMEKAEPLICNGLPSFFSMHLVSRREKQILDRHYVRYARMKRAYAAGGFAVFKAFVRNFFTERRAK